MDPPPARQEIFIEDFELFHTLGKGKLFIIFKVVSEKLN